MTRKFLLAALLGWLALAQPAFAQVQKQRTISFEGPQVFCHVLHHEDLRPIASLDALGTDPSDTLLILFGIPHRWNDIQNAIGGLDRFRKQGGNFLVVTDSPFFAGDLLSSRGMRIVQPEETSYRSQAASCPWIPIALAGEHPLFQALHKGIATNRPSRFNRLGHPDVQPLLVFPADVRREGDEHGKFPWISVPTYMAGSGKDAPPPGRMLFIAGQGMFMNGMMLQSDNDNFDFTVNAIRWLREGPQGKMRSQALLMVDGTIITDFDMNLSPPAALPTPQLPVPPVKALNRLVRGMEEERLFHKILRGLLGDHFDRMIAILITLTTFSLLLYGAKKFLEARVQRETSVPKVIGAVPPLGPGLSRGQQRHLALYLQPAPAQESRQLVHAWLHSVFGVAADRWTTDVSVAWQAHGFFWTRGRLQRQADWILGLVREPQPVSRREFAALVAALPELSYAVQQGRLTLLVDGKNVRQGGGTKPSAASIPHDTHANQ